MRQLTPEEYVRDYEERNNFISELKQEDKFVMEQIRNDSNAFLPFNESFDESGKKRYSKKDDEHSNSKESYYKAMKEQRFASQLVDNWMLPGHASNGKDSCGNFIPKGCLDKDNHKIDNNYHGMYPSSCGSIGCNKCFESAISKQAHRSSIRLIGVALNLGTKGISDSYTTYNELKHISISPPKHLWNELKTDKGKKKHKKYVHSMLNECGMRAGSIVYHPYTYTKGLKEIKENRPHWHIVAVGYLNGKQVKKIHDGDFKKNTNSRGYEYDYRKYAGYDIISMSTLKTRKEVQNVIAYNLSHAGIEMKSGDKRSSKQIVRYFGKANPRHFKLSSVLSSSLSAYDQIDKIFEGREKKTSNNVDYFLSRISLSVVEYDTSVSKAVNDYKFFSTKRELEEYLKSNVVPRYNLRNDPDYHSMCSFVDTSSVNSTKTKCVTDKFVCIKLTYSSEKDISYKVSDIVTIFFDPSISQLCPECSCKIRHLKLNVNNIEYQDNFCEETLPMMVEEPGKLFPSDTTMGFEYLTHLNMSHLGLQYFTDSEILYSNGRDTRPECFDKLNDVLKNSIDRKIRYQESARDRKDQKHQEWIKERDSYSKHEETVIPIPKARKTKSQKLDNF